MRYFFLFSFFTPVVSLENYSIWLRSLYLFKLQMSWYMSIQCEQWFVICDLCALQTNWWRKNWLKCNWRGALVPITNHIHRTIKMYWMTGDANRKTNRHNRQSFKPTQRERETDIERFRIKLKLYFSVSRNKEVADSVRLHNLPFNSACALIWNLYTIFGLSNSNNNKSIRITSKWMRKRNGRKETQRIYAMRPQNES